MLLTELKKIIDDIPLQEQSNYLVGMTHANYKESWDIEDFVVVKNDEFAKLVLYSEPVNG